MSKSIFDALPKNQRISSAVGAELEASAEAAGRRYRGCQVTSARRCKRWMGHRQSGGYRGYRLKDYSAKTAAAANLLKLASTSPHDAWSLKDQNDRSAPLRAMRSLRRSNADLPLQQRHRRHRGDRADRGLRHLELQRSGAGTVSSANYWQDEAAVFLLAAQPSDGSLRAGTAGHIGIRRLSDCCRRRSTASGSGWSI
jgi:hypothetical protein